MAAVQIAHQHQYLDNNFFCISTIAMFVWCVLHVFGRRLLSLEATHAKSASQLGCGLLHTIII